MTQRDDIEQSAARWIMRREEGSWNDADQAAFERWLEASLSHKVALWRMEEGWRRADCVADLAPPESAVPAPPRWRGRLADHARRWARPAALAASLVLALFLVRPLLLREPAPAAQSYRTASLSMGQITMEDGTRIELNTGTAVRTRLLPNVRDVWLDRGEAFFDVRHDEHRPFRVHAGSRTVIVLGTRFLVRREEEKVTVAVVSGRVRIEEPATGAASFSTIGSGSVAVADGNSTVVAEDVKRRVVALTAWREGMVIFDGTPLIDAAAQLNRYSTTPIRIEDPQIAHFRISGALRIGNRDGFLRLLSSAYGFRVTRDDDAIRVSR